jgi:hypothetical protein
MGQRALLVSLEITTVCHVLMPDQARCSCRAGCPAEWAGHANVAEHDRGSIRIDSCGGDLTIILPIPAWQMDLHDHFALPHP